MCVTSINVPPYHQQWFLQSDKITYLCFNSSIVTITLFILFICCVLHEMHGSILVYSNPCLFEVFTNCLLYWKKYVQQLHEIDLPEITCIIYLFHTLLKCLILLVQSEVDNKIKDTHANNFFDFTIKDFCHSTTIRVCCLSNKKCSLPIEAVSINMV